MNQGIGGLFVGLVMLAVAASIAFAAIVVIAYAVAIIVALFAFVAFAWSLVCCLAWRRPLHIGWLYVDPVNARAFVLRGLFGAVALPAFLLGCDLVLEMPVNWSYFPHLAVGGYTLLSAGLEYLVSRGMQSPYVAPTWDAPALPAARVHTLEIAPSRREPFKFASWDDEEA